MDQQVPQIRSERPSLKHMAAQLRKESTPAEALLWDQLRGRRLNGLKFRRQHVVHGYIVDFYCHEQRLCIELDGAPHLDPGQKAKDEARDAHLALRGCKVVRMMNDDVLADLPAFLEHLRNTALAPSPTPPL